MGLIRILAIFLLIYLGLRVIGRLLFPLSGSRTRNFEYKEKDQKKKKEGEVTIEDTRSGKNKRIKNDEGEYIDYEEVDE